MSSLPLLICLISPSDSLSHPINSNKDRSDQPIYSNMRMGEVYEIYIEDKVPIGGHGRRYKFRTRVEFPSFTIRGTDYPGKDTTIISDWRIANCFESTIDEKIIRSLPRASVENGEAEIIRAICGEGGSFWKH